MPADLIFCRDTLIVSLINCGTSLFAGFVIFTMMGYMGHVLDISVDKVVKGGESVFFFFCGKTQPDTLIENSVAHRLWKNHRFDYRR